MKEIFEEILAYVDELEIIDTHEHLPAREENRDQDADILQEYLSHYFCRDLVSSGLSPSLLAEVTSQGLAVADKWEMVEPYWEAARNTGYGRALDLAVQGLYGFDRIDGDTILPLNEAFRSSLAPGHYRKVLKDKSKIRVSLLDSDLDCDQSFFRSVFRPDIFISPANWETIRHIESETQVSIHSFPEWLAACEKLLDQALAKGAVALKSGLAYDRSLHYRRVTSSRAEKAFNDLFDSRHKGIDAGGALQTARELEDFMMHFVLSLAAERGLTFQFHTGLQEGNGNIITNSNPVLLNNLFLQYPDVKFDIFHIGYPYQQELSVLAKTFPNVFIDMCWAHIISPEASVRALCEWLDSVPANKICAFGGDYCFIDGVYGHQVLARRNVSRSLALKVEEGALEFEQACRIARMVFYDNPCSLFGLELCENG